ncbi:MAG: hypothetical protein O7A63_06960 [Acidobacteria bacterium]|nr:hypothetical protein [Acidobacteriota bacterium]
MRAARALIPAALLLLSLVPVAANEARYYRDGRYLVHEIHGAIPVRLPRIRIETDLGAVHVRSAPGNEVRYRIRVRVVARGQEASRRLLDRLMIGASRSGDLVLFTGQIADPGLLRGLAADFEIVVPEDASELEIFTGGGDLVAEEFGGRATLVTRAGNISAGALAGSLRAETSSGTIRIGRVGSDARLITGGGSVHLDEAGSDVLVRTSGGDIVIGRSGGGVKVESGGGDVRIDEADGDVTVGTGGGRITLGRIGGRVWAATAGGGIRIGTAGGGVRCETGAGVIELQAIGGPIRAITSIGNILADLSSFRGVFGGSELQTRQGDIIVSIPDSLAVTIRALLDNPSAGRIRSEFPLKISRRIGGIGRPIAIAEGDIAGGGSLLTIRSLGGDIVILKSETAGRD